MIEKTGTGDEARRRARNKGVPHDLRHGPDGLRASRRSAFFVFTVP